MTFLYFFVPLILIAISISFEFIFGFWMFLASIISTITFIVVWNSVDGDSKNDWKLVLMFLMCLLVVIISLVIQNNTVN